MTYFSSEGEEEGVAKKPNEHEQQTRKQPF